MKFIVMLVLCSLSSFCFSETPTDRAKLYFKDIISKDYVAAASHFDPSQLKEFRTMMEFYKEIPAEQQSQFIKTFFGENQTVESLQTLADTDFFAGLFSFIMKQAEAMGGLNFDNLEILGSVPEGDDIAHLVTRNKVSVGKIKMEAMEVISLKKHGDDWKLMLSGKIKGIPAQLKMAFSAPPPPPQQQQ